ncbi:UDP-N-acetylglucosamine 4,6-dehydratase (inverting) [Pseudomonas monteilii]|uniref:UDP-N-acetylglucosamine 4,6-dehydratase (Inverting) n=2 Tax=Pseudomonas TaxID=286 RepID=A0AAE6V335_9PSED|nr:MULTISPECIES: SDR family oxidoreductase [Pseudomonas]NWL45098.1 NAD(P)-dependent oxidoreductase [Pseudomonas hunanensis]QHB28745.1 UDP-N-acetylglucosamine 4,6-dehydratase (inverting) [Pseudomonas monteilii]
MAIAVTGATGQLGRIIIDQLRSRVPAQEIVAIVRNAGKGSDLGVELREADYGSVSSLTRAFAGVDTLMLISGSEIGQRIQQHANVISAAAQQGVKRIVYTSLLNAESSPMSLAPEHVATEQALKASGLNYTILRNGWYTENYTASIGAALANNAFYGSARDGKISSAPRADYAEAAAIVLTTQGHDGKLYELAGDDAYTLSDLAGEISRQTGKEVPYVDIPVNDYAAALKQAGLPEAFALGLASWDVDAANGALFNQDHQLSKLLGRPTTPFDDVVKGELGRLAAR